MDVEDEGKVDTGIRLPKSVVGGIGKAAGTSPIVDPEVTPMDSDRAYTLNMKAMIDFYQYMTATALLDERRHSNMLFYDSRDADRRRTTAADDAGTMRAASNAFTYHQAAIRGERTGGVMADRTINPDEVAQLTSQNYSEVIRSNVFKDAIGAAVGAYTPGIIGAMLVAMNLATGEQVKAAIAKLPDVLKADK
jgi:hypothetical protein